MTTRAVIILSEKGPKKPLSAQIKSTPKDVAFEKDGESQPNVHL